MGQTLVITDGSNLYAGLKDHIAFYAREWGLHGEFERLYDWLITETFYRVLNAHSYQRIRVDQVNYHDLYKCVWSDLQDQLTLSVQAHIAANRINFLSCSRVKILVTFCEIVFVRIYQDNERGI